MGLIQPFAAQVDGFFHARSKNNAFDFQRVMFFVKNSLRYLLTNNANRPIFVMSIGLIDFRRPAVQGLTFAVMLFPVVVSRSIESLPAGKLSVVFTARFSDGTEKMLRDVRKDNGITKPCEIGVENDVFLSREDCPLYFLDWAKNPVFGSFKKHYPKAS